MRTSVRVVLVLALTSAILCLATGISYFVAGNGLPVEMRGWLGTLALLGGSALGASGHWQERADLGTRPLMLVVLSALAAGYVAANVLALLGAVPDDLRGPLRALHTAGAAAGAVLYVAALVEATRAFGVRGRVAGG